MKDPRDVIIAPVVSEKSYGLIEQNVYTFVVHNDAAKPEIDCECAVTIAGSSTVVDPYPVVVPYSICVDDASLVVHPIVTPVADTPDVDTPDTTGGTPSTGGAPQMSFRSAQSPWSYA